MTNLSRKIIPCSETFLLDLLLCDSLTITRMTENVYLFVPNLIGKCVFEYCPQVLIRQKNGKPRLNSTGASRQIDMDSISRNRLYCRPVLNEFCLEEVSSVLEKQHSC